MAAEEAKLDLTPMIDVVFQLLLFFLVTFKQPDITTRLDAFRPAPDPQARPDQQIQDMVRITVHARGRFMLNQQWTSIAGLERNLQRVAARSAKVTILIQCSELSSHRDLVAVLDTCAKVKLTNLSVVTLPPARVGDSG